MSYQQPHQGPGAHLTNELSQRTSDPLVGRKVMTRYPDNGNFYEAIITDYNPVEVCLNLCKIHRLIQFTTIWSFASLSVHHCDFLDHNSTILLYFFL